MTIDQDKMIPILSTALLHCLDLASEGSILDYKYVGLVHSTIKKSDPDNIETWLIRFDTDTCSFTLDQIENGKYEDGTVIYWYSDNSDLIVVTDIFGRRMCHQSFENPYQI